MEDTTKTAELPNGPAQVTTDNKKERFKLEYGGAAIFSAAVRLHREGQELGLREAGARLFVVSKYDGWDVVTQTVRVAAVGLRPGDVIILRGQNADTVDLTPGFETPLSNLSPSGKGSPLSNLSPSGKGFYCAAQDWLLSVDPGPEVEAAREEVPVRGDSGATLWRTTLTAQGAEVVLRFRPHYTARHCPGHA